MTNVTRFSFVWKNRFLLNLLVWLKQHFSNVLACYKIMCFNTELSVFKFFSNMIKHLLPLNIKGNWEYKNLKSLMSQNPMNLPCNVTPLLVRNQQTNVCMIWHWNGIPSCTTTVCSYMYYVFFIFSCIIMRFCLHFEFSNTSLFELNVYLHTCLLFRIVYELLILWYLLNVYKTWAVSVLYWTCVIIIDNSRDPSYC